MVKVTGTARIVMIRNLLTIIKTQGGVLLS